MNHEPTFYREGRLTPDKREPWWVRNQTKIRFMKVILYPFWFIFYPVIRPMIFAHGYIFYGDKDRWFLRERIYSEVVKRNVVEKTARSFWDMLDVNSDWEQKKKDEGYKG